MDERECAHVCVCAWLCVCVCNECVLTKDELSPSWLPLLMFAQLRRDSADNRTVASGAGRASQPNNDSPHQKPFVLHRTGQALQYVCRRAFCYRSDTSMGRKPSTELRFILY